VINASCGRPNAGRPGLARGWGDGPHAGTVPLVRVSPPLYTASAVKQAMSNGDAPARAPDDMRAWFARDEDAERGVDRTVIEHDSDDAAVNHETSGII
jgi:hypothetical protein